MDGKQNPEVINFEKSVLQYYVWQQAKLAQNDCQTVAPLDSQEACEVRETVLDDVGHKNDKLTVSEEINRNQSWAPVDSLIREVNGFVSESTLSQKYQKVVDVIVSEFGYSPTIPLGIGTSPEAYSRWLLYPILLQDQINSRNQSKELVIASQEATSTNAKVKDIGNQDHDVLETMLQQDEHETQEAFTSVNEDSRSRSSSDLVAARNQAEDLLSEMLAAHNDISPIDNSENILDSLGNNAAKATTKPNDNLLGNEDSTSVVPKTTRKRVVSRKKLNEGTSTDEHTDNNELTKATSATKGPVVTKRGRKPKVAIAEVEPNSPNSEGVEAPKAKPGRKRKVAIAEAEKNSPNSEGIEAPKARPGRKRKGEIVDTDGAKSPPSKTMRLSNTATADLPDEVKELLDKLRKESADNKRKLAMVKSKLQQNTKKDEARKGKLKVLANEKVEKLRLKMQKQKDKLLEEQNKVKEKKRKQVERKLKRRSRTHLKWEDRFEQLAEYYKENGHSKVPRHYVNNPSLAEWVMDQRKYYRKEAPILTPERIEKMNTLEFLWNPPAFAKTIEFRIEQCKAFKEKYGHMTIPLLTEKNPDGSNPSEEEKTFRIWAAGVRNQYRRKTIDKVNTKLDKIRIRQLNEIGFDWGLDTKREVGDVPYEGRFADRIEQLKRVKEICGTCNDRKSLNTVYPNMPGLYLWVKEQRAMYRKWKNGQRSSLTEERRVLLRALDFDFNPRRHFAKPGKKKNAESVEQIGVSDESRGETGDPLGTEPGDQQVINEFDSGHNASITNKVEEDLRLNDTAESGMTADVQSNVSETDYVADVDVNFGHVGTVTYYK